jgi:hypothetical protein
VRSSRECAGAELRLDLSVGPTLVARATALALFVGHCLLGHAVCFMFERIAGFADRHLCLNPGDASLHGAVAGGLLRAQQRGGADRRIGRDR